MALLVLLSLGIGAAYTFFHRVSAKTDALTQRLPDAGDLAKAPPAAEPAPARLDENKIVTAQDGQCALFSKAELTRVLNTTFTHADADATGCTYKGDAPREFVRTEARWKGGRELVKQRSDAFAGLHQSMVNQHYTKAEIESHVFPINPYPGVGDEAWVGLLNIITARKGDVGIVMDLRYYDSGDLTKMLTNAALSRLGGDKSDSPTTPNPKAQSTGMQR